MLNVVMLAGSAMLVAAMLSRTARTFSIMVPATDHL